MQRYFYPQQGVANESLSEGLFSDPSQLRVSRANLSDAGQYGYAGPSPSTSQNYGPGWNGDTWSNDFEFSDHPAIDAAQRAAASQSGGARQQAQPEENPINLQLAMQVRRAVDAQRPKPEDRYNVFAGNAAFSQNSEPARMGAYRSVYGHTQEEETKARMAQMEAAIKSSEFANLPRKQAFDMNAQVAKDLGVNPEVLADAIDQQFPGKNPVGQTVHLRPHYSPDPMGDVNPDGSPKMIEVPGAPVFITPRLHRAALDARQRVSSYIPQGEPVQAPVDPAVAQHARWQELEAKAAAERQAAQAAHTTARNAETLFGFRRDAFQ